MAHVCGYSEVHYDPSRSLKVVDFGNEKRVYDFLLVLSSIVT